MSKSASLVFKIASEDWQFEQIHRLNYQTFVEEIPQHKHNAEHKLVDKFHHENTYVIGLAGNSVVAMIALRDKRPLSLDKKIEKLEACLPPFETILEYRLLVVKKAYRNTATFTGIMKIAFELAMARGYDIAVISGTIRQMRLYKHLGFKSFSTPVGKEGALYQPMYIDVAAATLLKNTSKIL